MGAGIKGVSGMEQIIGEMGVDETEVGEIGTICLIRVYTVCLSLITYLRQ